MIRKFVISLVVLALLAAGIFLLNENSKTEIINVEEKKSLSERKPPSGWSEYRDSYYRFSLFYPTELVVKKRDEGKAATTFIFEDKLSMKGFQIYALPYDKEEISEERFRQDVPSGIKREPKSFYIDGVLANSFYSEDAGLGETYEVWFIYEGFLYELTTLKPLESFLDEVIKTWKFI